MSRTRKMSIIVLAVVLAVCMSVPVNADLTASNKINATIDAHLQTLLSKTDAEKRIPVDIWLYETETVEKREQKIYLEIGLNRAQIVFDTKGTICSEAIDEYIETERSVYAEERAEQYEKLRAEYWNVQALQETRNMETRLFYSQYAPMISAELTPAEIKLLARDNRVQTICYSPNVVMEDESTVSIPLIGADYTRDTLGYDGSDIKIGMIESSLPDANAWFFSSNTIYCDPNVDGVGDAQWHANTVAAIMVGNSIPINGVYYGGIVPDATLYATRYDGAIDDYGVVDWRSRIEWLLSQGVHVINMSAALSLQGAESSGSYGSNERWIDHIVYSHYVHFVKSAGNNGYYVTSPGLAYNIITVGAINDNNTLQHADDTRCDIETEEGMPVQSSYMEQPGVTNKPDIMAPGTHIYTLAYENGISADTGTSFAAPHVTATVAQICGFIPSLKVMQPVVKAVLTASVSHSEHAYNTGVMGEGYDQFGAGVVNSKAAFETLYAYRMMGGTFPVQCEANTGKTYTFTASIGQRVRVSLTWEKYAYLPDTVPHAVCEPSTSDIVDLDLYIYDPDGVSVGNWSTDDNNTEIADFVTTKAGTYTIVACVRESPHYDVLIGVAWWLAPTNNLSNSN